jgi:hypothetical protein
MKTYEITVWLEVQIFFFFKLIIPEIQHVIVRENRQHNGQKKCTIGESYNARIRVLPRSDELTHATYVRPNNVSVP